MDLDAEETDGSESSEQTRSEPSSNSGEQSSDDEPVYLGEKTRRHFEDQEEFDARPVQRPRVRRAPRIDETEDEDEDS